MDDLAASGEEMDQTLKELEVINLRLGGNYVTTNGLDRLLKNHSGSTLRIADLGCGGGDILKLVARWAAQKKLKVELTGYDANQHIIEYAQNNCSEFENIRFEVEDIFSEDFKEKSFDVILCTLFTHHFHEDRLVKIFDQFKSQAQLGVVINDLHRHWLAYYSIKLLTQLFSKSPMVKNDGPLSVRRAFKKSELTDIMQRSGIEVFHVKWMWAFRWQLIF